MNDEELLQYMRSLDRRIEKIESSIVTLNHEFGVLSGKFKSNSTIPLLVKYVVFPLVLIVGGLVGVKLFLPL